MKKFLLLAFLFSGCAVLTPIQKSKLIAVFHLIEVSNFDEAKIVVEEMILEDEASQWARTWYARGLLAHNAYMAGIPRNNRNLTELYPDQLIVAFTSFERARILDSRGRLDRQIAPKYINLANELKKLGERHFQANRFQDAYRAFEIAIRITESPLLSAKTDYDLLYNAALAAHESKNHQKAVELLTRLHQNKYSTNVSHLLFAMQLASGDTLSAKTYLREGIEKFEYDEGLVLLLADLHHNIGESHDALELLAQAKKRHPAKAEFPYTIGLIHQKNGQYEKAIVAYNEALALAPDNLMILVNIATSYYNIGVGIEEKARTMTSNREVVEAIDQSLKAFDSAISWLNRAYDKNPSNQTVILKLYQLYRSLSVTDKARIMQSRLN